METVRTVVRKAERRLQCIPVAHVGQGGDLQVIADVVATLAGDLHQTQQVVARRQDRVCLVLDGEVDLLLGRRHLAGAGRQDDAIEPAVERLIE